MSRLLVVIVALVLIVVATAGAQAGEQRAGLVVQYGDGHVETACVRFTEPELTGVDLLERSGLPVITQSDGGGAAVCKIGPDGCDYPAENCFCKRDGARSIYWAFYELQGGAWAYSNLGAASALVRDGTVHGWAWGLGDSGSGAVPPVIGIDAVCGAAAPTVAPLPIATSIPIAVPTRAPATSSTLGPLTTATAPAATLAASETAASETAASRTALSTVTQSPASTAAPAGGAAPAATVSASSGPLSYVGFGVLALVLVVGAILAARRR